MRCCLAWARLGSSGLQLSGGRFQKEATWPSRLCQAPAGLIAVSVTPPHRSLQAYEPPSSRCLAASHVPSPEPGPHGPSIPSSTCDSLLSLYGSTPWASMGQSCQSCLLQNWILIKNIDFLLCKIAARKDFSPPFNAINWGRGWEGCDTKEQNRFQI